MSTAKQGLTNFYLIYLYMSFYLLFPLFWNRILPISKDIPIQKTRFLVLGHKAI